MAGPGIGADDDISGREIRMFGGQNLADRLAGHQPAFLDGGGVGGPAGNAPAHIRVQREEDAARQHLAILRQRHRLLDEGKIARLRRAGGAGFQDDGHAAHSDFPLLAAE
jgi:hypothetical protein